MTETATHHQRLAWDGARIVCRVLEAGYYPWLAYAMGERLGEAYRQLLIASAMRIQERPETIMVEAGLWRAELQDLLDHSQPERKGSLIAILDEASAMLRS
jgi:hypothetical protein